MQGARQVVQGDPTITQLTPAQPPSAVVSER